MTETTATARPLTHDVLTAYAAVVHRDCTLWRALARRLDRTRKAIHAYTLWLEQTGRWNQWEESPREIQAQRVRLVREARATALYESLPWDMVNDEPVADPMYGLRHRDRAVRVATAGRLAEAHRIAAVASV